MREWNARYNRGGGDTHKRRAAERSLALVEMQVGGKWDKGADTDVVHGSELLDKFRKIGNAKVCYVHV